MFATKLENCTPAPEGTPPTAARLRHVAGTKWGTRRYLHMGSGHDFSHIPWGSGLVPVVFLPPSGKEKFLLSTQRDGVILLRDNAPSCFVRNKDAPGYEMGKGLPQVSYD
jgi:hypothetical protein